MPKISETTKRAQASAILKGLAKRFKSREKLMVAGTVYTIPQLTALLRGHLTALTELRTLRAALAGKVQEERAIAKQVSELRAALFLFIGGKFGRDPVTLGLATQTDLDFEVNRANKEKPAPAESGATLLPASETTARKEAEVAAEASQKSGGELDVGAVFAKLKQLGGKGDKQEE